MAQRVVKTFRDLRVTLFSLSQIEANAKRFGQKLALASTTLSTPVMTKTTTTTTMTMKTQRHGVDDYDDNDDDDDSRNVVVRDKGLKGSD